MFALRLTVAFASAVTLAAGDHHIEPSLEIVGGSLFNKLENLGNEPTKFFDVGPEPYSPDVTSQVLTFQFWSSVTEDDGGFLRPPSKVYSTDDVLAVRVKADDDIVFECLVEELSGFKVCDEPLPRDDFADFITSTIEPEDRANKRDGKGEATVTFKKVDNNGDPLSLEQMRKDWTVEVVVDLGLPDNEEMTETWDLKAEAGAEVYHHCNWAPKVTLDKTAADDEEGMCRFSVSPGCEAKTFTSVDGGEPVINQPRVTTASNPVDVANGTVTSTTSDDGVQTFIGEGFAIGDESPKFLILKGSVQFGRELNQDGDGDSAFLGTEEFQSVDFDSSNVADDSEFSCFDWLEVCEDAEETKRLAPYYLPANGVIRPDVVCKYLLDEKEVDLETETEEVQTKCRGKERKPKSGEDGFLKLRLSCEKAGCKSTLKYYNDDTSGLDDLIVAQAQAVATRTLVCKNGIWQEDTSEDDSNFADFWPDCDCTVDDDGASAASASLAAALAAPLAVVILGGGR